MPGWTASSSSLSSSFLGSFCVAKGLFDLGGRVSPGSIRDQIVRTRLFMEAIRTHGFLNVEKDVCIIGAGPAGLTAAIELSRLPKIRTWLVDRNPEPLSLLARADHRRISPTLYDWPSAHFRSRGYSGIPTYDEGAPSLVREKWLYEFEAAKTDCVTWIGSVKAVPDVANMESGPPWRVELTPSPTGRVPTHFDLVLLCRGFGRERSVPLNQCPMAKFQPFPFWSLDPYPLAGRHRLPNWGDTEKRTCDCVVVVLGGGDGAIQDMLRFITDGMDTRHILNEIEPFLPPAELAQITAHAENDARYKAFAAPSAQLRDDLISEIKTLIERIDNEALCKKTRDMIRFHSIRVYFREGALGPCYPLNQFLALLFQSHIKAAFGWNILFPNHEVKSIACSHAGEAHFDRDHTVFFESGQGVRCRVVVPRLGIDSKTAPCERPGIFNSLHHVLPYWLDEWKPK
jgi:hypothetical protein